MSGASASSAPPDQGPAGGRRKKRIWFRVSLLFGGAVALITGTATGLHRLGYDELDAFADIAALHGPLMVCGFFGTVISLERAVAMRAAWAYAAPLAAGIGSIAMIAGAVVTGQAAWIVSGLVLAGVSLVTAMRHPALFTTALFLGASAWAAGTLLWAAGTPLPQVVLWWLAFLILTIAAERLELSRLVRSTRAGQLAFVACLGLLVAAACLGSADSPVAWSASGVAMIGLTGWLFRNDVARRTIRLPGLPRYTAACLLGGYAWLGIAGVLAIGLPVAADAFAYDAILHAILLGFAFAMVFGHAPIILPAVAGVPVPFASYFYAPLVLLHVSVAVRVGADLSGVTGLRQLSGPASAAALAFFIAMVAAAVCKGRQASRSVCASAMSQPAGREISKS